MFLVVINLLLALFLFVNLLFLEVLLLHVGHLLLLSRNHLIQLLNRILLLVVLRIQTLHLIFAPVDLVRQPKQLQVVLNCIRIVQHHLPHARFFSMLVVVLTQVLSACLVHDLLSLRGGFLLASFALRTGLVQVIIDSGVGKLYSILKLNG